MSDHDQHRPRLRGCAAPGCREAADPRRSFLPADELHRVTFCARHEFDALTDDAMRRGVSDPAGAMRRTRRRRR